MQLKFKLWQPKILNWSPVGKLPACFSLLRETRTNPLTDIAYSVVPGLLPDAAVHELLGPNKHEEKTKKFMRRLRSALPTEWRRHLNSDSPCELSSDRNLFHIIDPKTNKKIPTLKLTTKKIYDILIEKSDDDPVKRYQKWNLEVTSPISWKNVWKTTYDNFSDNKFCDLYWRVLHRSLPLAPVERTARPNAP